ncbi:MAG: TIGR00366 family protein [Eubacterium ramulus]
MIFLILGIAFHKTPIGYVRAITESAESAGGIILQFPFYAGIQGMMVTVGSNGVSLASAISNGFVSISTTAYIPGTVLSGSWYCKLLRAVRRWTVGCSGSDHDACRSGAWCYTGSYCYGYRLG